MTTFVQPGLILARRAGEVVVIELPEELGGHKLYVSCVQIDRNQTKLGIQCPSDWNIYRGELRDTFLKPEQVVRHRTAGEDSELSAEH